MNNKQMLVDYLLTFVTEHKKERMLQVVDARTRHLTVILEDIYQHHNASAIVRTCEIFGVQDLHVIEKRNVFKPKNTIAMGSAKWLDLHHYTDIISCITALKKNGYRIVATMPDASARSLFDLPLDSKLALMFGTEGPGITPEALAMADEFVTIPMYGFTESFNVSVSAALCMQRLITSLHASSIDWRLSEAEKLDLMHRWLHKLLRSANGLEAEFLKRG